ncbi:unnamed protein product [Allacma fusca]|uniref:Peptidase S9A N-terminal domain-containing protein n=1 Tax=Allacma fusca TaxID=39272 RepID=A0A8J2J6W2_9HEXA|nr:unnamed protein product [Allacma fusca]
MLCFPYVCSLSDARHFVTSNTHSRYSRSILPSVSRIESRENLKSNIFLKTFTTAIKSKMVPQFTYPDVRRDDSVVDNYHGTEVVDPYRWLEDPDSEEVKHFVEEQNKVTVPYLESCPVRENIRKRLTDLFNYPKYSCPVRRGNRYYYFKNSGLQNQSVVYVQDSLDDEPRVFLDPNLLSDDGTVAMSSYQFSEDGEIFAYALSSSGSDWVTIHFKNVTTGENYPEVLKKAKFTRIAWTHDNLGIFYGRYPDQEGKTDGSETTSNENQKLYYHRIGTSQEEDVLVAEFPDHPKWRIRSDVSDCGNYLIVCPQQDCRDNLVFFASLVEPLKEGINSKLELTPIITNLEADYDYVTNDGSVFHFKTNKNAPNYRIVSIDLNNPHINDWVTLVSEHPKDVLDWASAAAHDKLVVCYIHDVKSTLSLLRLKDGSLVKNFPLEVGTVIGYSGKREHTEMFFQFASFLTPGNIFHVDLADENMDARLFREVTLEGFDASKFTTTQVFYPSKDGTQIPMFIVHKKDIPLNGNNLCQLYGYGGFNVSILPTFSAMRILFMDNLNGILAVANIRGGG